MKNICDSGGIRLSLDFGNTQKNDVIAIIVFQFIISDYKYNNILYGRNGIVQLVLIVCAVIVTSSL